MFDVIVPKVMLFSSSFFPRMHVKSFTHCFEEASQEQEEGERQPLSAAPLLRVKRHRPQNGLARGMQRDMSVIETSTTKTKQTRIKEFSVKSK
jgi:hypothetical protein